MISKVEAIVSQAALSYRPDTRFLAVLRMGYGLWVILFPVDLFWMASVPDAFVNARPGLFAFVDAVPPVGVLIAICVIRFVLAVLLALGVLTLPVSILLTAVMVTASGLAYSFSKVDHFILFELVPVFLAFAGWGRTWSVDALVPDGEGDACDPPRGSRSCCSLSRSVGECSPQRCRRSEAGGSTRLVKQRADT